MNNSLIVPLGLSTSTMMVRKVELTDETIDKIADAVVRKMQSEDKKEEKPNEVHKKKKKKKVNK